MTHSVPEHPAAARPGARGIMATAWRFRRLVAACVVVCLLLAAVLTLTAKDRYTATAKLLFRDPGLSRTLFGSGLFEGSVDPARNASTNVEIVKSEAVSRRVERALGRTTARLPGDVEVEGTNNADVVSIAATADTARDAAAVANAYAREYIAFQRDTDRATVRDARETVERSLAEASAEERAGLIESARQLRILETLQTGNAEIIARAPAPASPSQPQPRRNLLIGLVAGLLLGVGLAVLRDRADRRLRSSKEIEEAIGRPVLARIPSDPRPADVYTEPSAFDEPYRQLRESLRYLDAVRAHRCLVVTSADPGEGTTTVATNLARALVADGERVLLIDAGLARGDGPGEVRSTGFAEVLGGRATLDEAIVPSIEGTYPAVLKAGTAPPNSVELLRSPLFDEALQRALDLVDRVVLDAPPLLARPDTHVLLAAPAVDAALVVARSGIRRRRALELADELARVRHQVLGVAVTDVPADTTEARRPLTPDQPAPDLAERGSRLVRG